MTITMSSVWIPWAVTLALILWMFRPYEMSGSYDFGQIFRLFWLVPILAVWIVYLLVTR